MNIIPQIKTSTKILVDSLLERNTSNRKVRRSVVDAYKKDIADGRWFLTNQGIGIDWNGVLVDGQHRLLAIQESNYPALPLLIVSGLDPEVKNVIDQHAKRSIRDTWRLVLDTDVSIVAPAICGVIYKSRTSWGAKYTPFQLKDILDEYFEEIEFVIRSINNSRALAAPYLAACVVIAKERPNDQKKIKVFLDRVIGGENLNKKMPEFHMRNLVIDSKATSAGAQVQMERFLKTHRALIASIDDREMLQLRA